MACNGRYWNAVRAWERDLAAYNPLDPETSRTDHPGWDIVRATGDPVWCGDCKAQVRRELASLDDLASLLLYSADGYESQPRTEKVASSAEPGSPSPAADTLDEMDRLLAMWEKGYRDLKRMDAPPPRGDDADRRTTAVAWLTSHLDGILSSAYAQEFGLDVLDWRRILARSAKAGRRTLRLPLRCPGNGCHQLSLTWVEGSDRVECGNRDCGLIMSRTAYDDAVLAAAAAISHGETDAVAHAGAA
jgi:hypothetical protein